METSQQPEIGEPMESLSYGGDAKPTVIDAFFYNDFPGVFAAANNTSKHTIKPATVTLPNEGETKTR